MQIERMEDREKGGLERSTSSELMRSSELKPPEPIYGVVARQRANSDTPHYAGRMLSMSEQTGAMLMKATLLDSEYNPKTEGSKTMPLRKLKKIEKEIAKKAKKDAKSIGRKAQRKLKLSEPEKEKNNKREGHRERDKEKEAEREKEKDREKEKEREDEPETYVAITFSNTDDKMGSGSTDIETLLELHEVDREPTEEEIQEQLRKKKLQEAREALISKMQQRCLASTKKRQLRRQRLLNMKKRRMICQTIFLSILFVVIVVSVEFFIAHPSVLDSKVLFEGISI